MFPFIETASTSTGKKRLYDNNSNEEGSTKRMRISQNGTEDFGQTGPLTLEDFKMENLLLRQRCQRLEKIIRVAPLFIRDFKAKVAQGLEVHKNKSQELQRTVEQQQKEIESYKSTIRALVVQRSTILRKDQFIKIQNKQQQEVSNQIKEQPQVFKDPEGDVKDKPQTFESLSIDRQMEVVHN